MPHDTPFDPRSILCVPADNARLLERAAARGADIVMLDLEDGVAPASKSTARSRLAECAATLRAQGAIVHVRVNNEPALLEDDVAACIEAGVDGIVLPKIERAAQLIEIDAWLDRFGAGREGRRDMPLVALIETPVAVISALDIARASRRLVGLGFGPEDFAAVMSIVPEPVSLSGPTQTVAMAAVACGLHPLGLAGTVGNFTDLPDFLAVARHSRALGMRGAICIHPAQVELLNDAFGETAKQVDEAERLLEAFQAGLAEGRGAINFNGRMVDEPIAERARRVLARHRRRMAASTAGTATGDAS